MHYTAGGDGAASRDYILSAIALSYASPTEPIEGMTFISPQRLPNA